MKFSSSSLSLLLSLLALLCASALSDGRVAKEHTTSIPVPQGWTQTGRAMSNHQVRVTLALTQRNLASLENFFWLVSDPLSSQYGNHLTMEEVNNMVAPSQETKDAAISWLSSHNIKDYQIAASGDFVYAYGIVADMEQLLQTTYYVYKHSTTGQELVRALEPYTVAESVAAHIDFVGGLSHFPKNTKAYKPSVNAPMVDVDPSVIKSFFKIDPSTVGNATNNTQAVAQFLNQYYAPSDLTAFQKKFDLPKQPVTNVVGPNNPKNPGVEASLDIQYIMAIAPNVPTWFVYTDGLYQGQEPFLDWIVNMSSSNDTPLVHSVSYGDVESSISITYAQRVNNEFMKYGATGRSILFASGDDGTGCSNNCKVFAPNWPATSPYVTAVGGMYLDGSSPVGDEISSGGFSNYFSQPSYQTTAVSAYIQAHNKPASSAYNASGRAVPDISSFSENVLIYFQGGLSPVAGTSCAAPVISGVIALLNDARLQAGKSSLGFLNPFLYQTLAAHPDAFTDVTKGNNQAGCCATGFSAAAGWDPITGVGVPNFPNLKEYALAV